MAFKRVNGRIDIDSEISSNNIVRDEEEQRGARTNKFWFNNYEYMYKDVYQKTYEDYAEVIACKLAERLGIECARYDLAVFKGNFGVITTNLIKDNENEELLSGTEIITRVYTEYIVPINKTMEDYQALVEKYNARNIHEFSKLPYESQISLRNKLLYLVNSLNINNKFKTQQVLNNEDIDISEIDKIYQYLNSFIDIYSYDFTEMKKGILKSNNLYDIWNVLEIYAKINNVKIDIEDSMDKLINMFIFDIITSQGDRHADNWGIIINRKNNTIRICPLYDNSGICHLNREKAIMNIVEYVKRIEDLNLHENKKNKIESLLQSTIDHSNSGLKVDIDDWENKSKNQAIISNFLAHSSEEFVDRIMSFVDMINEDMLNDIFIEIEHDIELIIPSEVKTIVKTVILSNTKMIRKLCGERGLKK